MSHNLFKFNHHPDGEVYVKTYPIKNCTFSLCYLQP